MADSSARYIGVSSGLTTGSSPALITSIVIVGWAGRGVIPASHWSAVVPGKTRQSIVASAIEGITFTLGGSPTPDRRLVREIVECWIALLNLFAVSGAPMRRFLLSTTGNGAAASRSAKRRQNPLSTTSVWFLSCGSH